MKNLLLKAKGLCIENSNDAWDCNMVVDILCKEYPNIPRDIMKWFIVRHANQADIIMKGLNDIDAYKIVVIQKVLSNEELQNESIIENAPFSDYEKITDKYKNFNKNYYNIYFPNGTWKYPIVAVEQNGKLYVIDGTCRFWHMKISLYNKYDFIKNSHLVNIFTKL